MAETRVAELHVREEGTGSPVLLLHGLGGDHTIWNRVIPLLAKRHRVVAPDLRGHGRSPTPEGSSFSFTELEGDLLHLLDRLSLPSVHVVGTSAGGFLAIDLALDAPERVRSLFLIGSAAHADAHMRAVAERWRDVYRDEGFDAYVLRLMKDLVSPEWLEAHLDYLDLARESLRARDLRGAVLWGEAMRSFDRRGRIGRIRSPVFLMHGLDDAVVDAAHARLIRQTIPTAEVKLVPNAGHLLPVERPEETAEAILGFLSRVESPAP